MGSNTNGKMVTDKEIIEALEQDPSLTISELMQRFKIGDRRATKLKKPFVEKAKAMKERPGHAEKYLTERCPLGKFGEPDDIGTMTAVLCSEQAKFCQGTIFPVDGGQSRHYFYAPEF